MSDEPRVGFFTDTSICIGCKACEVACKEWNQIPMSMQGFTGKSYDNTIDLGADTWRHVAFIEQGGSADGAGRPPARVVEKLPADATDGAGLEVLLSHPEARVHGKRLTAVPVLRADGSDRAEKAAAAVDRLLRRTSPEQ